MSRNSSDAASQSSDASSDLAKRPLLLSEYSKLVGPTDKMPRSLPPVLFGLFGEVGGVMATSKKCHREKQAYAGYREAAIDEFGDVLWYLAAICRRLNIDIEKVFSDAVGRRRAKTGVAANALPESPLALVLTSKPSPEQDPSLLKLGQAASRILHLASSTRGARRQLANFANYFVRSLQASGLTFSEIARHNASKTRGRFLAPLKSALPTFDSKFEREEQIPRHFEIRISERKSGKSYLEWNDVFIGDPLTDNIKDKDGYRFHDVFHFAHAAVLHWSPVFRALIKHKRKSISSFDENEDGGRAIVIEEGLTAWIFAQAKRRGFFDDGSGVSFDLLKSVEKFVSGFEVQRVPLKQWESAILQGYAAFLKLRDNNGGILIGDLKARTLRYKPLKIMVG